MSVGFFDIPAPIFQWADNFLALRMSPSGRIVGWALVLSVLSMLLYARLSPQSRIEALSREIKSARLALVRHDGDFSTLSPDRVGAGTRGVVLSPLYLRPGLDEHRLRIPPA